MALGNYGKALGQMARESVTGSVKGFGLGLKSAALREMPGFTALYGLSREVKGRADKLGAAAEVVKEQRANNVISLEMVRQLRSINQNVMNQARMMNFQVNAERQRMAFAEETEREKEKQHKDLVDAIRGIGRNRGGGGTAANDASGGGGSFLSNLLGSAIGDYLGYGAAGLGGLYAGKKLLGGGRGSRAMGAIGSVLAGSRGIFGRMGGGGRMPPGPPGVGGAANDAVFKRGIGKMIGRGALRAVPYVGWGLLAYEVIDAVMDLFGSQGGQGGKFANSSPTARQGLYGQNVAPGADRLRRKMETRAPVRAQGVSQNVLEKIIAVESGGRNIGNQSGPRGKATSTAFGVAQMTEGTFGDMVRLYGSKEGSALYDYENPKLGIKKGKKSFDDMKKDVELQKLAANQLIRHNAGRLQDSKVAVTDTSLYLSHFLGVGGKGRGPYEGMTLGAIGVMGADENAPVSSVLTDAQLRANPQLFAEKYMGKNGELVVNKNQIKTIGQLKAWAAAKMGETPSTGPSTEQPPLEKKPTSRPGLRQAKSRSGAVKSVVSTQVFDDGSKLITYSDGSTSATNAPQDAIAVASVAKSGTQVRGEQKPLAVEDAKANEIAKKQLDQTVKNRRAGEQTAKKMEVLVGRQTRPQRKSLIERANETFLNQFQSTTARLLSQQIYKAMTVGFYGKEGSNRLVSRQQASSEMFRGQEIAKMINLRGKTEKLLTNVFGKDIAKAYAPMIAQLGTAYLEVGARFAGRGLFSGAGFSDKDADALSGQILGNFARGNKQAATEQLLYGMTGIASGPESIFFKYGFQSSQQGANFLGNMGAAYATAPISGMMGGGARTYRDPVTGQVYATDTGPQMNRIWDSGAAAMNGGYRQYMSAGTNNPYLSAQNVNARTLNDKNLTVSDRATVAESLLAKGTSSEDLAKQLGGINKNTLDQLKASKEQFDESQKAFLKAQEDQRKFEKDSQEWQDARAEADKAKSVMDDVMKEQDLRRNDLLREIASKTGPSVSGTSPGANWMSSMGNFAFDLGTSMIANKLTSGIKNPYLRALGNFAIASGANAFIKPMLFGTSAAAGAAAGSAGAMTFAQAASSAGGASGFVNSVGKSLGFDTGGMTASGYMANVAANMGMTGTSNFFAGMNATSSAGLTTAGQMGYYANQALPYLPAIVAALQGDMKSAAAHAIGAYAGTAIGASLAEAGFAFAGPIGAIGGFIIGTVLGKLFGGGGGGRRPTPYVERAIKVLGNNDIGRVATVASGDNPPASFSSFGDTLLKVAFNAVKLISQVSGVQPPFHTVSIVVHVDYVKMKLYSMEQTVPGEAKWVYDYGKPGDGNSGTIAAKMVDDIKGVMNSGKSAEQVSAIQKAADRLKAKTFNSLSAGLITELKRGPLALDDSVTSGIYHKDLEVSNLIEQYQADLTGQKAPTYEMTDPETGMGAGRRMIWSYKDNAFVEAPFTSQTLSDGEGGTYQTKTYDMTAVGVDKNGKLIYNYNNQLGLKDYSRGQDSIAISDLQKHVNQYYPELGAIDSATITPTDGTINTTGLTYNTSTGQAGTATTRGGAVSTVVSNSGNQNNDNSTTVNNFTTASSATDQWRMNGTNTGYAPA